MIRLMNRISPIISPAITALFIYSTTASVVQASSQNFRTPFLINKTSKAQTYTNLFDGDMTSGYAPAKAQVIEHAFDSKVSLESIQTFGSSDYLLSIHYKINGVWESSPQTDGVSLDTQDNGWNTYKLSQPVQTDKIRLSLIPLNDSPKAISEIKFQTDRKVYTADKVISDQGVQAEGGRLYRAAKIKDKSADTVFAFQTAYSDRQIKKASLHYEVEGVSGGASVIRSVNDELSQGGLLLQPSSQKSGTVKVTEEINPQWLHSGLNKIKFFAIEDGAMPKSYTVKNVQLVLTTSVAQEHKQPRLVAYAPQKALSYKEYAYIRGFVEASPEQIEKITVDGKTIVHNFGAFEALVQVKGAKKIPVVATLKDGTHLKQEVAVDTTLSQFQAKSVQLTGSGVEYLSAKKQKPQTLTVYAASGAQTEVKFADASLKIKSEALQSGKAIKVAALDERDMPELDQGMVNVTKEETGYRFLPHGIKFDVENQIQIAYDESKLPEGTTAKDVKTYFFDEETGRWMPLQKIASANGVVVSKTNHFTDMINAVIKTPDAPEAKAYGATQIKDLKVANPGAKINLIEAPKASAMGDAQLSYPIEIPAGRHGMSPQLGVSYSSGASNSWMGLGWNLSIPSVDLDTRWGVPRYDAKVETETYTVGGQQLSPVAHRSAPVTRTAEKTFYPRVEGSFNQIIRHGDSPKNYWWEITSTNGAKSFYGGHSQGGFDSNTVLTDDEGNIAHWALTQSIDTYGNTITYDYAKVQDTGVGNDQGTVPGYQLYIKHINYTGYNGDDGAYDVVFTRDRELSEARRTDVGIDARLGFKRVTADLLRKVEVKFQGSTFRSYEFVYTKGAFEKTLLSQIKQYDANGALFNTHRFDYFDEVRDASGQYVAFKEKKSWIGEAIPPETDSGTDKPVIPTLPTPGTPTVTPVITPPQTVIDDSLGNTVSSNLKGLQNALEHANDLSRVQLDLEGILTQGSSLFHQSKENNGFDRQQFILDGSESTVLAQTAQDGALDIIYAASQTPVDYVRVWKAPFEGTVSVTAPVMLLALPEPSAEADGVRIAIQHQSDELWNAEIAPDDHGIKTPEGVEHISVSEGDLILFRVQALSNGTDDVLSWSPVVTYDEKPSSIKDANTLPLYTYGAANAYIAPAKAAQAPMAGEALIQGDINKPHTSDDVTLTLLRFDAAGQSHKIWEQTYSAAQTVTENPDFGLITVESGDKLFAMVSAKSMVDFKSVQWSPALTYKNAKKSFIDRIVLGAIDTKTFSEPIVPHYAVQQVQKSSYGWEADRNATISVTPAIPENTEAGIVRFTVKSDGHLLAQSDIGIVEGETPAIETLKLEVSAGQRIYFEYYYAGDLAQVDPQEWIPSVLAGGEPVALKSVGIFDLPPSDKEYFYRGWTEKFYDASAEDTDLPIELDKLQSIPSEFVVGAGAAQSGEDASSDPAAAVQQSTLAVAPVSAASSSSALSDVQTEKTTAGSILQPLQSSTASGALPGDASSLSGTESEDSTLHMSVTVGPYDGVLNKKTWTAGGKFGSGDSDSKGTLALVDIDGDSLPDQVVMSGGSLGYRKNLSHDGIESFAPFVSISGAGAFHHSKTSSSNKGAEAHFGVFAGYSKSSSTTTTDIYFADVNGDGLIDIVSKGIAYYNKLDASGTPNFSTTSAATPNPIDETGELSAGGWVEPQTPQQLAELEAENPLHDTVRVWQAPEAGIISIAAPVNLIEDTSAKRASYTTADGVRVAIQHRGAELWNARIQADDYSVKNPQNVGSVAVIKGDRIYFRVQSVFDGMYDKVNWAPKIVYTDKVQSVDANSLPYYSFDSSHDFTLFGYDVTMPISGTVSIQSTFSKPSTSDDVVLRLVKVDTSGNVSTVWEENTGKLAQSKTISLTRSVSQGENYRFIVYSDTNVDWANIDWKPTVTYTQSSTPGVSVTDAQGNYSLVLQVAPTLTMYNKTYRKTTLWMPASSSTVEFVPGLTPNANANGEVTFSVKQNNTLLAKKKYTYQNGVLTTATAPVSATVAAGMPVYVEYHTNNAALASALAGNASVEIIQNGVTATIEAGVYSLNDTYLFGPMYRNWGQFVYNANDGRDAQPILETKLVIDPALLQVPDPNAFNDINDEASLQNAFATNGYDPAKTVCVPMMPRADTGMWQGMDTFTTVDAMTVSSSRFGLKNLIEENLIPASTETAAVRGIAQIVKTKGDSVAFGGGAFGISGSASKNEQKSQTLTQFSDMNGDHYPDIVGTSQVQYTTMLGALEASAVPNGLGVPVYNETESTAYTLGGTFATGKIETGGQKTIWAVSTQDPNAGISGNTGESDDEQFYNLRDINGDGLPDRIYKDGTKVALNLGYCFAPAETWNFSTLQKSVSESEGGGVGINLGNYSIGAGLAISTATNSQTHTLTDLNSDGLIDEAYISNGQIRAKLNTGNGFGPEIVWNGASRLYESESKSGEVSATFTVCIPITPFAPVFEICFNPGGSVGEGSSHDEAILNDIDGDGNLDFLRSTSTENLEVSDSTIGKTNLLKTVYRPLGAKIAIDYTRSGNTYANPHHKWVLGEVEVFDGHTGDGSDTMKQKFEYGEGYYDRYEREFYGFAWVTSSDIDTANGNAVYRKNISHYINSNYYEKGLLDYTKVVDGADKLYVEKFNAYETIDIFTESVLSDTQKKTENNHITFSKLTQAQTRFYEGTEQAGQITAVEFAYDQYGNVISQLDYGDVNDVNDDWSATVTYHENLQKYIVTVPETIKIFDDAGTLLRDREATVDEYGAVTQVRVNTGSAVIMSDMDYDIYGNLIAITYPPNHKGQRYALNYAIDDTVHTYTTSMSDSFGYTATAAYDYRFGEQTEQRDINAQPILTTLDAKGRLKTITGPLEADAGIATITHSYYPDADVPYAITQHYDEGRADTIDTVTFVDGLMRVIQTKKDAAIDEDKDGVAMDMMSVSGHVTFDSFGRTVATYYPVDEALGNPGVFNAGIDTIAPTRTQYDILDRKVKTTLPDGATLSNTYGFGNDREGVTRFHTLSTDTNGYRAESFKDVRERITSVLQHNPLAGQEDIWTSYSYNAVNELLEVKDDHENLTQAVYDLAGRRTHIHNPDTGWIESIYDDAGNVVSKITDNLRAKNKAIAYTYDYNRLTNINYPFATQNNVVYTYGNNPAQLNAGRITGITDASGERLFEYGKLGETTKETRTLFTYTSTEPKTYVTQYRYDTWNRLREIIYPDTEVLTHTYDSGGQLSALQGVKGEYVYDYLKTMTYDKFAQRVFTKYANDTTATYSYEEERRRLSNLVATDASRTFMDNTYSYDKMQNILGVSNSASVPVGSSLFGGETSQSYSYDNLYQITAAEGSWTARQGHEYRYNLAMSYDTIGNIKAKNQLHEKLPYEGDKWIEEHGTTYDWTYDHEAKQPHAPTKIGNRTFTYDLNGNQTGWEDTQNANNRVIEWDEENRISTISDNGHTSYYVYDAGGERSLKRTSQGETFYVNAYFVIREGEVASKHFYAGSQRIATKLTKQESQTVHGNGGNDKPVKIIYEKEQYFYHPDHLGSSSFVTDEKGEVYEHLEYFPFGETFVHEHSNTQITPYLFTGKELDEESGLYYYGARYYDPRTSVWQSPDPIIGEYMSGQTNGGVFNPKNLSLMSYTYNNPVNLVDPDGRTTYVSSDSGVITNINDNKDQVIAATSGQIFAMNGSFSSDRDAYNSSLSKLEGSSNNLHLTSSEYGDLSRTIYQESGSSDYKEAGGIYGVLVNRAKADHSSVMKEASNGQVAGWNDGKKLTKANMSSGKMAAVNRGIAMSAVNNVDYSNGAYFWDGLDLNPANCPHCGGYSKHYKAWGMTFSDASHNRYGLPNSSSPDGLSPLETTGVQGKTTFTRFTNPGASWYIRGK